MIQTRPKDRKSQITQLALDLLQTKGYENFSYHDISLAMGITKASIHYHFPKKEDLGVALCNAIQQWHHGMFEHIQQTGSDNRDKLNRYIQGLLDYAKGNNKICPLSSLQADVTSLPAAMLAAIKALDQHELIFIASLLEAGRQQNEFNFTGESQQVAAIVVLTLKGALQYSRIHGSGSLEPTLNQLKTLLHSA